MASILDDIAMLSDASMQGRKTGTEGASRAAAFVAKRYQLLDLKSFDDSYYRPFIYGQANKNGVNVVGYHLGCGYPQYYIVITAHYDHLGTQGRQVFHGADDNASGVAAMLAVAEHVIATCPPYSYIFVATDAEESGLIGSKAFVAAPPISKENILLNINLDMVSRADRRGRLYLTGAKRFPQLMSHLRPQFPSIQFLSHNGPSKIGRNASRHDWPNASDHGSFYRADIPYLFFGGQDHPQYHTVDDQWQRIAPEFIQMAMNAILNTVDWLNKQTPHQLKK